MDLEEASTQNRLREGWDLRTVPLEALLIPQRAVSKKPCRGVWDRSKGIIMATSYSMQVAPGDRVKACKDFCLT